MRVSKSRLTSVRVWRAVLSWICLSLTPMSVASGSRFANLDLTVDEEVGKEKGHDSSAPREARRRQRIDLRHRREIAGSSFFFFQAEDGIRDLTVTGVQTCALPI